MTRYKRSLRRSAIGLSLLVLSCGILTGFNFSIDHPSDELELHRHHPWVFDGTIRGLAQPQSLGYSNQTAIEARQPLTQPSYDIPIVMNDKVVRWMDYFQGRGRPHYVRWLSRYYHYEPMIDEVLREYDLPSDFVFLAMIESGFKPSAYSRARAAGMWQFMRRTGQQYGLRVTWWIDERRDPMKATRAAARHIRDLHDEFGDWYLVAAAYNAGSGKVNRAIRRYDTRDFWELAKNRYLKRETKNYVPKLLAATIISKNPGAYGFRGISKVSPPEFEVVEAKHFTDLSKVARFAGVSLRQLRGLNPELRRDFTPPNWPSYKLRVPSGTAAKLSGEMHQFKAEMTGSFLTHRVRSGESLWNISRRYGTTTHALVQLNGLSNPRLLRPGHSLMIPTEVRRAKASNKYPVSSKRSGFTHYRVRQGDTLWGIAKKFRVPVSTLRHWNNLGRGNKIYAGAMLKVKKRS